MFFSLLSAGEFAALLTLAASAVTLLYLLERTRQRKVVSSLRFWKLVPQAASRVRKHRVQQPWSLILQLLSILLLLLALAGLRWGNRPSLRNHVLLMDTSSASAMRLDRGTVLDREKDLARNYVAKLRSTDRVLVVYANGLLTPATPFLPPGTALIDGLRAAASAPTALNLDSAVEFARRALRRSEGVAGDIVYVGPGRVTQPVAVPLPDVRVLPVKAPLENYGITSLTARRSDQPGDWSLTAQIRNESFTAKMVQLDASFGATAFARRTLRLAPQSSSSAEYAFTATAAGELHLVLSPSDDFPLDNEATLPLPENRPTDILVVTNRADLFAPLLSANRRLIVHYVAPAEYRPNASADVVVFDQFAPATRPRQASLWNDPPVAEAPMPLLQELTEARIDVWSDDPDLGRGLRSRDMRLARAHAVELAAGDIAVASAGSRPVAAAHIDSTSQQPLAMTAFDVLAPGLRFQLSSPLLIANMLRWLRPQAFDQQELACAPVGLQTVALPSGDAGAVRVTDASGAAVPVSIHDGTLQFFADRPGPFRVSTAQGTRTIYISLPQLAEQQWPMDGSGPLSHSMFTGSDAIELWRALALCAFLCLLCEWLLFRDHPGVFRFSLKAAAGLILLAAMFDPRLHLPRSRVGVVALVDTSASIGSGDRARSSAVVKELAGQHGSNWFSVLPFAGQPADLEKSAATASARSVQTRDETDLEAALVEGTAAVPAGYTPRLLLLSDGNETRGSVARAMRFLQTRHVQVDVIPMTAGSLTPVSVQAIAVPPEAYAGEQVPVSVTLQSPRSTRASLSFTAEGKTLGRQSVQLVAGSNLIRGHIRLQGSGAVPISATVEAEGAGSATAEAAVRLQRANVLYLSGDSIESAANLLSALRSAQLQITNKSDWGAAELEAAQMVILDNLDLNSLSMTRKEALARFVEGGGGLLLLGGEHQQYKEEQQMDVLDRVLPAKLAPPRNPEGICVALIIDKSSSMEGRKIELARLSAVGVVDHLRERDSIGVLIFDNSYQWAVPMRRADNKALIRSLISGITPDGGTQIAPALAEAYRKVMRSDSVYKHIVLMTDGISEEGDSMELAREALEHQVTISTVGLGQDVNRTYLEKIAATSGGKSYFLSDPQGLEQVLLKDVEQYEGKTAVEKPLLPLPQAKTETTEAIDWEHAPPLQGYARYEVRPGADVLLAVDGEKRDPLFVEWPFGLGRAAVWASDAKSRWARGWLGWPGFDQFWTNVSRELMKHRSDTAASAQWDEADRELVVTYRLEGGATPRDPVYALGPQGFQQRVTLREESPGVWRGRVRTGGLTGFFRVRPLAESKELPEIGVFRVRAEFRNLQANEQLLRELAAVTGGQYDAEPRSVFRPAGQSVSVETPLLPILLGVVLLLTIAELAMRKLAYVKVALPSRFTLLRSIRTTIGPVPS